MKLSDHVYADARMVSHVDLEQMMEAAKLHPAARNELRLLQRDGLKHGYCSISTTRLDGMYPAHSVSRPIKRFMRESGLFRLVKKHCPGRHSDIYALNLRGVNVAPTDIPSDNRLGTGQGQKPRCVRIPSALRVRVGVHSSFFRHRAEQWAELALGRGWSLKRDYLGATSWGKVVQKSLDAVRLPKLTEAEILYLSGNDEERAEWWRKHYGRLMEGASRTVSRIRGRVYHAISNLPAKIRALIRLDFRGQAEPVVTLDMHASYLTQIVGRMSPSRERDDLIRLIQTEKFYEQLNEMLPWGEQYDEANRPELKKQFQAQCLFWLPCDHRRRPIWETLRRRFPELAQFILFLRERYG